VTGGTQIAQAPLETGYPFREHIYA